MKKTFSILLVLLISNLSYSQKKQVSANKPFLSAIYGNIGFNPGAFYVPLNINLEKEVLNTGSLKINGRTGAGFWVAWTEKGLEFPFTGQFVFFKNKSHLEIGGGIVYIFDFAEDITGLSHILNIAYRFQKPESGFMFRVGIEKNKYVIYPFLSFGHSF